MMKKICYFALLVVVSLTFFSFGEVSAEPSPITVNEIEYENSTISCTGYVVGGIDSIFFSVEGGNSSIGDNNGHDFGSAPIINGTFNITMVMPTGLINGEYIFHIRDAADPSVSVSEPFTVSNAGNVSVTGVSLDRTSCTLTVGESTNLIATVAPSDATLKTVTWTSNNDNVTVDNGTITAKKVGTSTVTVTTVDGAYTAECVVTIQSSQGGNNDVMLSADKESVRMYSGYTMSLKYVWEGCERTDIVLSSTDSSIVSLKTGDRLTQNGEVTLEGKGTGTATIHAYVPGTTAVCDVEVTVEEDHGIPCTEYYFFIMFKEGDTSGAALSGITETDARAGFWVKGFGDTAKDALVYVSTLNGWDLSFDETYFEGWLQTFFGLDTINNRNGTYTYWSQYHWDGTRWAYNQYCLGYLKTTEYQYIAMVYETTAEDVSFTALEVNPSDIPDYVRDQTKQDLPDGPVQHTHSWDAGTVTKEPTCTEAGEKTYTCSCGETKTEALPSLGHDWSDWILITDATTEHDGLKERTCSRCGEKESVTIPKIVVTDNADGSQTKTEELIDGTEVTTTTGTETVVTAVSEDGSVSTTASSDTESKELVTEVKVDGTDGSCIVSDDTVQTAIRQQEIVSDAIGDNGKEKVFAISSATENVSASLEKGSLSDLAENDVNLRVASTQGSMTFGKDVLTSLSEKDDVTLSFSVAERSDLTESQKETIEIGSTVVSLTAMSNGQSVGRELGGKVTVVVKHTAAEGKDAVAYYVDGEGNRTKVAEQYYDAEKGEMTMVLDHFSIYVIMDEEPEQAVPYILYGLLAFIVVVCLGIMFPQVFGRKQ